jgi:hypothetical protein
MDGAREQRAGQGGVDPRLTALDEVAILDGSPWNTTCVDLNGEVNSAGRGPPEARPGRHTGLSARPALVQVWLRTSR